MEDSMALYERMKRAAELAFARGEKSKDLYTRAAEQKASGFSVSAPYTRLLASFVRELEQK